MRAMRPWIGIAMSLLATTLAAGCGSDVFGGDHDAGAGADACVGDCDGPGPLGQGLSTLAGWSQAGAIDGVRAVARFDNPVNTLVAPNGHVYVADFNNHKIRKISGAGDVTTLFERADFQRPFGMALTSDGAILYVQTDRNPLLETSLETGTIWRIEVSSGEATVLARDIGRPRGLAVLNDDRLALVDYAHHTVRLLNPQTGAITPLAGKANEPGRADGAGTTARFRAPYDVVVDGAGNLLVADQGNHVIRRITPAGVVSTFAGTGSPGWDDGAAAQATFDRPQGLAIDDAGNVYISDADNYCVRRFSSSSGQVSTVAGDRVPGFLDSAQPLEAQLFGLEGLDVSADGSTLYIADGNRGEAEPYNRIRRLMLP